jgi:DNA-binding MarR family transcriptional regulator
MTDTETDLVDELLAAWRKTRPDLDPEPLAIVGRVIVLAQHLEQSVNLALAVHEISLGQFDILATLRRHSPRGGLTPKQLLNSVVLSSGGMTSRLDRLEREQLIVRRDDPEDRRGVIIELTAKGRKLIDAATRFDEARQSAPELFPEDTVRLTDYLRQWLRNLKAAKKNRVAT